MINDFSLRYYNHQGSIGKSRKYFLRLVELKKAVNIEEFESSLNRASQIYFNQFEYGPLVDIYEILLQDAENVKEAYRAQMASMNEIIAEYFSDGEGAADAAESQSGLEWLGKMYSSLGQAYAFSERYEDAEQCFRKAIGEFNTESNKMRTLGYQLHAYISSRGKALYLQESPVYFQSDNPGVQMSELIKRDICGLVRYDLFVWLKGVWTFELYKATAYREAVRMLVKKIREVFKTNSEDFFQHPWALIFKYLYWICRGDKGIEGPCGYLQVVML